MSVAAAEIVAEEQVKAVTVAEVVELLELLSFLHAMKMAVKIKEDAIHNTIFRFMVVDFCSLYGTCVCSGRCHFEQKPWDKRGK